MSVIRLVIQQPVTVAVGVILVVMAGLVAIERIPVQLTPTVEDTIISVSTMWEGASPEEVEQEIVDKQEEKLQGLTNLRGMTSESSQGGGRIRLEFNVGTSTERALREISDKLREVPSYPEGVDEPVIEATDFENRDFIAWIILGTTDPELDIRSLQDFAEDRIKPALERIEGMSEVGVLGGYERETQVRFDPALLAQRGVTPAELVNALRGTNVNVSAGELNDGKRSVRVRTISRYESVEDVEATVIKYTTGGPILVGDVADVAVTFKEPRTFVRSKGEQVLAINCQREIGSNVMDVMDRLRAEVAAMNAPGGLLEAEARAMGLRGALSLNQVYDQTIYIDDALDLVQENIWVGGLLATITLLIFLRSLRSVAIVVISTPISVVGAIVAMVALGRTINVVSLAGMAFAIGMVVDNSIVVLENIFRHLEMGKKRMQAALDGAREVWGAILAATLTNIVVFVPILLIAEEAGQLFRDIALAICATCALSLLACMTVVPAMAARLMKTDTHAARAERHRAAQPRTKSKWRTAISAPLSIPRAGLRALDRLPDLAAGAIDLVSRSAIASILVVAVITAGSLLGSWYLMPPSDYLPTGNRNLVFGMLLPPPGYNIDQLKTIGERVERDIRPYWEAGSLPPGEERNRAAESLPQIATFDFATMSPGRVITPPPLENYFFVAFDGIMFHGGVSTDPKRVVDMSELFMHATRAENAPGVMAFAFQAPLFQLGGSTGSAIKIDFAGGDLAQVAAAANAAFMQLGQAYGFHTVQPSPSNFNLPGPEMQIAPDRRRLSDLGMTPADLGLAVQTLGDGAIVGEYRVGGEAIDLKVIARESVDQKFIGALPDTPIATPGGQIVPMSILGEVRRVTSPPQINRVDRQRAVTLMFTPPASEPLEAAIAGVDEMIATMRAQGVIPADVETSYTGSASKLRAVKSALLGDGTLSGLLNSSLFLAIVITYLLMCVLFQSFLHPLVIMISVPLATLGGFAALAGLHAWSLADPYMPDQKLDVLVMLGFIILIGVVVNNAILIVHQALNFMKGISDAPGIPAGVPLAPRQAIVESVRSRVRPILMSLFTSVVGMLPLVIMPGSGSELYRGLGSVVVGGLLCSTIFTIIVVPLLMNLVMDVKMLILGGRASETSQSATPAVTLEPTVAMPRVERPRHASPGAPLPREAVRDASRS
jgi:HAE1 family hydrophobic/amphiphilic exporter-1